jgi:hypothetical protein
LHTGQHECQPASIGDRHAEGVLAHSFFFSYNIWLRASAGRGTDESETAFGRSVRVSALERLFLEIAVEVDVRGRRFLEERIA